MISILLDTDLANAIIDMDDIAYEEGLGPKTREAWNELVLRAELVAERKTDCHRQKSTTI